MLSLIASTNELCLFHILNTSRRVLKVASVTGWPAVNSFSLITVKRTFNFSFCFLHKKIWMYSCTCTGKRDEYTVHVCLQTCTCICIRIQRNSDMCSVITKPLIVLEHKSVLLCKYLHIPGCWLMNNFVYKLQGLQAQFFLWTCQQLHSHTINV